MAIVYLGVGSNLGNRTENIKKSIIILRQAGIRVFTCSTLIETDPVGGPPQNLFINGVLKIETNLSPEDLLVVLHDIEKSLGRVKTVLNGPRTIDLDILLYDQLKLNTPTLTIPHPRMFERDFVMKPLQEIAPELFEELSHARH